MLEHFTNPAGVHTSSVVASGSDDGVFVVASAANNRGRLVLAQRPKRASENSTRILIRMSLRGDEECLIVVAITIIGFPGFRGTSLGDGCAPGL